MQKCQEPQKPQQVDRDVARSLPPATEEHHSDEEEEEDEEETETEAAKEETEQVEDTETQQEPNCGKHLRHSEKRTHWYKKLNTKNKGETQGVSSLPTLSGESIPTESDDDQPPDKQLLEGKIPDGFLRQMFYTLGDYKDILEGKNDILIQKTSSGSDKEMQEREEKIKGAIQKFFENGDSQTPSVKQTPSDKRKSWWNKHGEHIWNGMICALTYKENSSGGEKKIEKDSDVYKKFFGENNPDKPGTTGTYKEKYDYEKVKLDENSGTSPKPAGDTQPPTLKNFVVRPTYFRYLEEWGEEFCKKRTEMLGKIKYECRGERGGHQYCSGDGHDCTDGDRKYNNMFADLDCRDCHEQCRKYRKWIDIKFDEYHKQEKKYEGEHEKLNGNSNGDYKKLKEYCKTCPFNGVTCNRGTRGKNGECTP
ncbi:hypothetical protein PFHG_05484, partial [Plasmodium falciparum HB3]